MVTIVKIRGRKTFLFIKTMAVLDKYIDFYKGDDKPRIIKICAKDEKSATPSRERDLPCDPTYLYAREMISFVLLFKKEHLAR